MITCSFQVNNVGFSQMSKSPCKRLVLILSNSYLYLQKERIKSVSKKRGDGQESEKEWKYRFVFYPSFWLQFYPTNASQQINPEDKSFTSTNKAKQNKKSCICRFRARKLMSPIWWISFIMA